MIDLQEILDKENKNSITDKEIPIGVKKLQINYGPLPKIFPKSLNYLELSSNFDNALTDLNIFPENLETLIFGYMFNQKILPGLIPKSVRYLKLPGFFNRKLRPGTIPEGVQKLEFGSYYNKMIVYEGILPKSLLYLDFGGYNQPLVDGVLPVGLKHLKLPNYNHPIGPESWLLGLRNLEVLEIGQSFCQTFFLKSIPLSLTRLSFNFNELLIGSLPPGLKCLSMTILRDCIIEVPVGFIPKGVSQLSIYNHSSIPLKNSNLLPPSVVKFQYYTINRHPLPPKLLPCSLKEFNYFDDCSLSDNSMKSLGEFVNSIRKLSIKDSISESPLSIGFIPQSVETLRFGPGSEKLLSQPGILPDSITSMEFTDEQCISPSIRYPPNLKKLVIRNHYNPQKTIPVSLFPPTLNQIKIWTFHLNERHIQNMIPVMADLIISVPNNINSISFSNGDIKIARASDTKNLFVIRNKYGIGYFFNNQKLRVKTVISMLKKLFDYEKSVGN
eukprot:gene10325-12675_t